MPEQVVSYKCPACGAALRYTTTGKMGCISCGNSYEVETLEKLAQEEKAPKGFNWEAYREQLKGSEEKLRNTVTYICQSCGAAIETDGVTAATHCPYCDNEVIAMRQLTGGLRPNGVIPFAVTPEDAVKAVRAHFRKKPLLPRAFLSRHKLSKVKGIYVPFWLFNAGVHGDMSFDGTRVRCYSDNDYNYTETSHFLVNVAGRMRFCHVPVDGSVKMDDDLMDALEPFDYSGLKPFDPAYLSGFLADRFDEDPDKSFPRASDRMQAGAESLLRAEAGGGYATLTLKRSGMELDDPSVQYVLLPVYILNLEYEDKKYRFAVNGQTGKVVGELPVSKEMSRLYFGTAAAAAGALTTFLAYLLLR
ncbi:MAG: hypothetical protein IJT44_08555 [Clostridia bacterium]|nr:hypothetical protein [Clostridia bacterium]